MSKDRHEEYKEHKEHEKQTSHKHVNSRPEESREQIAIHKIVVVVAVIIIAVFGFMSLIGVMP